MAIESEEVHAVLQRDTDRDCVLGRITHDRHDKDADKDAAETGLMRLGSIAPTMISLIHAIPAVAVASTNAARCTGRGRVRFPFRGRVTPGEQR